MIRFSSVRPLSRALRLLLACIGFASVPGYAQPSYTTTSLPAQLYEVIQASDGNFYGVTRTSLLFNPDDPFVATRCTTDCGTIYRITPAGVVTALYTFSRMAEGSNGIGPSGVIEGPDGYLYGVTAKGGPNTCSSSSSDPTCGVFFRIGPDGTNFQVVHNFTSGEVGTGGAFEPLVMANDGYLYGVATGVSNPIYQFSTIFRISLDGTTTLIHTLSAAEGTTVYGRLVQAAGGDLYGTAGPNHLSGASGDCGSIFRVSTAGTFSIDSHFFPVSGYCHTIAPNSLAGGPDGALYGTSYGSGPTTPDPANIFRRNSNGTVDIVYALTSMTSGQQLVTQPVFGADGNLYGIAGGGGDPTCNCGTFFQVTPAGGFTVLHAFVNGADGGSPVGTPLATSDGSIAVVTLTGNNTRTNPKLIQLATSLPAPVQLSFTIPGQGNATGSAGTDTDITLNWKVLNAFSDTLQQCYAFAPSQPLGTTSTWTGKQTGTYSSNVLSGSLTFRTPTVRGTYVYALTCGGVESGQATLIVGSTLDIVTATLPNATVSKLYDGPLAATGGVLPYVWGYSGTLPDGLIVDANSGTITGTPKQFGTYQVTVGVQDASNPALIGTTTLQLVIASGLGLSGAYNNGIMGTAYTGATSALGGLGPYKWVLASGKLPDGLTLNANTGVITGTPTSVGKFSFSITLSDGEKMPATVTQAYTISTAVEPLVVTFAHFDCTVKVSCVGSLEATGGTPPYTWTVVPDPTGAVFDNFPTGLTLATDGSFSGLPLQATQTTPTVRVTDSETPTLSVTGPIGFSIVSGMKLAPIVVPMATVGVAFKTPAPVVTGGLPPYRWTVAVASQVLKEYAADPATGVISSPGPMTPGTFALIFTVFDAEGIPSYLDTTATLLVQPPPVVPVASSLTLTSSTLAAGTGMNVTLTAKAASTSATPTGTVTFYNGTTPLGTSALDRTATASLTTSFSSVGVYVLSAAYSGDAVTQGSKSPTLTETVVTPSVTGAAAPGTLTLTSGESGTILITLTPAGGYTGTVSFTCGQLPQHISCTFAPPSVTIAAGAGSVTDTLTINTAANTSAALEMPPIGAGPSIFAALALWIPASMLALFGVRRKAAPLPRLLALCLLTLSLVGTLTLTGCGSTSPNITAAAGTYSIPVTLTLAGGTAQTVTATIIVK